MGSQLFFPRGFFLNGIDSGIKDRKKRDIALIYSQVPCVAAGLFTKNRVKAAPVVISQKHLRNGRAQAILVNSGSANACTGNRGIEDAKTMAYDLACQLGIRKEDVLLASTGVIGRFLPMSRVKQGIKKITKTVGNPSKPEFFTEAIMTTDTTPKIISSQFLTQNRKRAVICGLAKGAGMIHPDLATLLCFIITDIAIHKRLLQKALMEAAETSFNSLTIDGDTSTNDSVLILANGRVGNRPINSENRDFLKFQNSLNEVTRGLAELIARDGEGATKLVRIIVNNAKNSLSAKKIARHIASSPLVKTALYGSDPNWGRLMAAIGSSGIRIDPQRIDIYFGKLQVARNGQPTSYSEMKAKRILKKKEIEIVIDLKQGTSGAKVYTCDLTPDYVKINSCYST
ncbi:bifunctional glutamate N-acetyltransferase/amino-acid acetyltransferase ArgJ [bacterium]|nr:bifunctional glutamate N-acetyltransferase/amino-acid acetyltransferase ArgJ [bacterium]NIN91892.1 bifunctional glutamate N-acetyltransferase/amino-acid acetyltransferase ArgJ [bacterium]NIO18158.1 bifunctional glutamate N-acetyltransferase/amino-acid acetyltransferase ArgJ [bacterium]NIO73133.1 bifunctional glutamate N-acetyltransferase/amino-acid acetyltransferase ArgJ [bacterium]